MDRKEVNAPMCYYRPEYPEYSYRLDYFHTETTAVSLNVSSF